MSHDRAVLTDPDECRHLTRVMRKRQGDALTLVDGCGSRYDAIIDAVEPRGVTFVLLDRHPATTEPAVGVDLAPAILKGNRLDGVIEMSVQLGVRRIIPMQTSRTLVEIDPSHGETRHTRWERIALSAMKQSLRAWLPPVERVTEFDVLMSQAMTYDTALIAWEGEQQQDIASVFAGRAHPCSVLLLVGPEGGFAAQEIERARAAGLLAVSLGPRRLRGDTAGIVALTLTLAAVGELQPVRLS